MFNKMRKTTEQFINECNIIDKGKYDTSKVRYINNHTKVCFICHEKDKNGIEHGEFWQKPTDHLHGHGCPKCACKNRGFQALSRDEFIKRSEIIHNGLDDYSKVEYKDTKTKVCIICKKHGEYWMTPDAHMHLKQRCPKCSFEKISRLKTKSLDILLDKACKIHKDKYDYSKVEKKGYRDKVCIICHEKDENGVEHGEFWQPLNAHLQGHGCPKCAGVQKETTDTFIRRAKEIHSDKYDYSKINYVNNRTKVCIICPIHGEFWQTPVSHLHQKQGCPKCKQSKLENEIEQLLIENSISFERQKKFKWLVYKYKMALDFYLPDYNMAIECQGRQHFEPVDAFGGEKSFIECKERDIRKKKLCNEHNIVIVYYSNLKKNDMLNSKKQVLKLIKYAKKII
jgi:hypothetical protein